MSGVQCSDDDELELDIARIERMIRELRGVERPILLLILKMLPKLVRSELDRIIESGESVLRPEGGQE